MRGSTSPPKPAHRSDPPRADPAPDWQRPREILLTGSTGFLGLYLLRELLTATTARVHCLVRADGAAHARRRIAQAAERYGLGALTTHRIEPLPGDLAEPNLGLDPGPSASSRGPSTAFIMPARR